MSITVARFLDVADGLQPGRFTIGEHAVIASLADLDPIYKQLLDDPVIFTEYIGSTEPYALCDPSIDERRVLFELDVDRIATFGKP
jgi:hypothetical protein